ncbi:MAG: hypothetical protein ACOC8Y_00455 [Candidatus Natronoplasma sp.]
MRKRNKKSNILPFKDKAVVGIFLFLVGGIALMGFITAEVLYPGYTRNRR